MHVTEGWLLFLISFALVSGLAVLVRAVERRVTRRTHAPA
jgi:hypothetical protein